MFTEVIETAMVMQKTVWNWGSRTAEPSIPEL
jgi:hypothetical protein